MSKLKTVWDAVNELRGDLNNTYLFDINNDAYLFHCTINGNYACSVFEPNGDDEKLVCTNAEFNALVEEMELGLDVNSVTHGHYLNYVYADKILLEKETKPDYTSLEFWKDAPEGKDYLITYKSGVVANVLNFFSSEPEVIDGYYRIKGESVGYGQSSWELFKRPQSIQTETPEEKEALDSIVNKPLIYTQEMADNGELLSVGMKCLFKMNGEYKAITVLYNSQEVMVFSYIFDGVMVEDARLKPFKYVDIKPIDTRTKKEKAIDEIESELSKIAYSTRSALELAYDEWVGE